MQLEEYERQRREALEGSPYHLVVELNEHRLPSAEELDEGRCQARFTGRVVRIHRAPEALGIGDTVTFTVYHCIPRSRLELSLIGGVTVTSDPLLEAPFVEVVFDRNGWVPAGLVVGIREADAPSAFAGLGWM